MEILARLFGKPEGPIVKFKERIIRKYLIPYSELIVDGGEYDDLAEHIVFYADHVTDGARHPRAFYARCLIVGHIIHRVHRKIAAGAVDRLKGIEEIADEIAGALL